MPPTKQKTDLTQLSINTIRFLAVDAVEKAKSGHPGMPMGMAPAAYVLWTQVMKFNPKNPRWPNRDRFVLSAGHGSMLLYALLHLCGYDVSLDDLKNFRQWGSKTPGHPEFGHTPGVETTTGPLGQGIATATGMAIAQRYLNRLFPDKKEPLLDHKIYGIASDGDLMEGVGGETASLAGHLGLSNLIFFYDDNHISIDGPTELSYSDDVEMRFKGYHWNVLRVKDGNDVAAIQKALADAQKETARPTLIITRTTIGYGSPNKANTGEAHGSPLGPEETKLTKDNLGWPQEPAFFVPEEVRDHFASLPKRGAVAEAAWRKKFDSWAARNPRLAALWNRLAERKLPEGWENALPAFEGEEKMATRKASGAVINALAPVLPELIGGSADLTPSNNTLIKKEPDFSKTGPGRNIRFGVREHAMAAAMNGIALTDMLVPFGGTFFIFSDYMKGGMRISALTKRPVIYVLTHDSIGLGEDGPTHQPVEQAIHLRALPNFTLIRPADARETVAAWKWALEHRDGPVGLALTRQNVPVFQKSAYPRAGQVEKGAYVLSEAKGGTPDLILIGTGSEVSVALKAKEILEKEGAAVRVVSMPSWEIYDRQPQPYRDAILPPSIRKRISIEALSPLGWERYTTTDGLQIGLAGFGASAPGGTLLEKFGFTPENVAEKARTLLK